MKKIFVLLLMCSMFATVSCKNNINQAGDNPSQKDTTQMSAPAQEQTNEFIKGRLDEMYAFILGESEYTDADEKFFTKDFFALQEKVLAKQNETQNLYIDHDHWIMGQDCHNPSYEFVRAEDINSRFAKAYVNVKAYDTQEKPELVRFTLKYEEGKWKVDDIEEQYEGEFYSHRKEYEKALAE